MRSLIKAYIKAVSLLSRICGVFSTTLILLASVVVCQMVVMRYGLGESTVWQSEFIKYAIIAATLLGSPYVLLLRGHVSVDIIYNYISPAHAKYASIISSIIGLLCCALIAWAGWLYFYEAWHEQWVTPTVWGPPLWIPLLPLPLGLFILTLQYLANILIYHVIGPEELST
jgi:TRAP-type C4-dicarboxylate transport system permease small subunit